MTEGQFCGMFETNVPPQPQESLHPLVGHTRTDFNSQLGPSGVHIVKGISGRPPTTFLASRLEIISFLRESFKFFILLSLIIHKENK